MECALREAKARLSELVTAAERGERVVITKHGNPAVELLRCRQHGGIDFAKLDAARRRLGIEDTSPEELEAWQARFEDPVLSLHVLGLDDDKRE